MITTSLLSTETFSQPYRTFINTRGHYAYNNGNGWSIFTRTEKMQIGARGTHGINLSSLRLSCMTRLQSRCWFPEKQEILFRLDLILEYFFVFVFLSSKICKTLTLLFILLSFMPIFLFLFLHIVFAIQKNLAQMLTNLNQICSDNSSDFASLHHNLPCLSMASEYSKVGVLQCKAEVCMLVPKLKQTVCGYERDGAKGWPNSVNVSLANGIKIIYPFRIMHFLRSYPLATNILSLLGWTLRLAKHSPFFIQWRNPSNLMSLVSSQGHDCGYLVLVKSVIIINKYFSCGWINLTRISQFSFSE